MKPHSRKFLENSPTPSTATSSVAVAVAAAVDPSSWSSRDYDKYPRPYLIPTNSKSNAENDTQTSSSQPPISAFDSSMALTVVVLLAVLFIMGFFSVYIHRLSDDNSLNDPRRRRQQGRRGSSSSGLDPSIIQSLPLFAYDGTTAKAKETLDCPICLSEFEKKETVKVIPFCGHVFHPQCIDMWLSVHGSCPLCRSTQLLPPPPPPPCDCKDDYPSSSTAASWFVAMEERVGPVGGGHASVLRTSTDNQSFGSTGIEIECVACRRRAQRQRDEVPKPSSSRACATRANSFSSSIFEENRYRTYSLSLPRSSSF